MNFLDYFVLIVIVASTVLGAMKGILKGLLSLASTILGWFAAMWFYRFAAVVVRPFVETERAANLLGFIAVFLLLVIAGSLVSYKLRRALKRARLDWFDKALGATFGFLRGWLACAVMYLALTAFPIKLEAVQKATFAPLLLEGTRVTAYLASGELSAQFSEGYQTVTDFWQQKTKNKK
ncbi:MAG: CvpA family protein [Acidobacteriota bacterium]